MTWVAVGVGSLSLASSFMGEADANEQMQQKAGDYGTRKAGLTFSAQKRVGAMVSQAKQISENVRLGKIAIDRNQARAEAEATVSAAQSGVAGDSVNQVIGETEVNAAHAKGQTERNAKSAKRDLEINFVDTLLQADINSGRLDTSTKSQTGKHVLAFGQGFISGGGSFDFGGSGAESSFDSFGQNTSQAAKTMGVND